MTGKWYKCDVCGHDTLSEEDITGQNCIAGDDFVADPALRKVRDDERRRVAKQEPTLKCVREQEQYIKTHGCIPFGFPFYRIPGKYFLME